METWKCHSIYLTRHCLWHADHILYKARKETVHNLNGHYYNNMIDLLNNYMQWNVRHFICYLWRWKKKWKEQTTLIGKMNLEAKYMLHIYNCFFKTSSLSLCHSFLLSLSFCLALWLTNTHIQMSQFIRKVYYSLQLSLLQLICPGKIIVVVFYFHRDLVLIYVWSKYIF